MYVRVVGCVVGVGREEGGPPTIQIRSDVHFIPRPLAREIDGGGKAQASSVGRALARAAGKRSLGLFGASALWELAYR